MDAHFGLVENMRIEFTRGWGSYRDGQVFDDFHNGSAEILIARGLARRVEVREPSPQPPQPNVSQAGGPNRAVRRR